MRTHTHAVVVAAAFMVTASFVVHADAQVPEGGPGTAVVVVVTAPALFHADGSVADGSEERLTEMADALSRLESEPLAGFPFALAPSAVLCDELVLLGTPAAGRLLEMLRALAPVRTVLLGPHANVRLTDLPTSSDVRGELEAGRSSLEECTGQPAADVLLPPGWLLDEEVLGAAGGAGITTVLADVATTRQSEDVLVLPATFSPEAASPGSVLVVEAEAGALTALAGAVGAEALRPSSILEVVERATPTAVAPAFERHEAPPHSYLGAWARSERALQGLESYTLEGNRQTAILRTVLSRARSSADWDGDFAMGRRWSDELIRTLESERRKITLTESDVTFTSQAGSVPVTVANDAAYPVRVRIRVDSAKLDFPAGDIQEVVVSPPGDTITFDAVARSTGTFPTIVTLSSPGGDLVLDTAQLRVRSVAANLAGIVLTAGGALFFLIWVIRRWRRGKVATAHPDSATVSKVTG